MRETAAKKIEKPWSRRYEKCVRCGGVDSRHVGLGLCDKCWGYLYNRQRRSNNKELGLYREIHKNKQHKPKRWAGKYDRCRKCGTADSPHVAHGLCRKCYNDFYNSSLIKKRKKKLKVLGRKNGRKLRPCAICKKLTLMVPGQAFCKDCKNSDKVRFGASLPSIPGYIRRKVI